MLANLWNLEVNASKNAHSVHVLKCVHEDEGCREQWSSLGGHVSGHQHIISSHIHHQHHHHHYYIQFNHYYSIMSSDAKYEVLRVKSLKKHILQAIKESSKFGIYGPPSGDEVSKQYHKCGQVQT